jgi:hypothetical protein
MAPIWGHGLLSPLLVSDVGLKRKSGPDMSFESYFVIAHEHVYSLLFVLEGL